MHTLVSSAGSQALRGPGHGAHTPSAAASAVAKQPECRQRIGAGDPTELSDGIRRPAVTAELMEHYRRQARVMQNAGPAATAELIEHYRRQAHDMRSAEMGAVILQVARWLLSGLRRRSL